jgi:hypothetical protein
MLYRSFLSGGYFCFKIGEKNEKVRCINVIFVGFIGFVYYQQTKPSPS